MNILLTDGERIMTAPTNSFNVRQAEFGNLIEDKLGKEALVEYKDILYDAEGEGYKDEFESYEASCEEYHSLLNDTMLELEALIDALGDAVSASRLSRDDFRRIRNGLQNVHDNIYRNT